MKKAWDKWGKTSKLAKFVNKKKYDADVVAKAKDDEIAKDNADAVAAKDKEDDETAQQAYDRSYEKHGDNAKVPAGYEKDPDDPEKIHPKGTAKKKKKADDKQAKQDKKDLGSKKVTPDYKKKIKDRQQKAKTDSMPKTAADVKNSFEPEEKMTEQNIEEAYFKVNIPNMPTIYIEGGGEGAVRKSLRGTLKPDAFKSVQIAKVKKGEILRTFKADLKGKSEEVVTIGDQLDQIVKEAELDESNELQAIMALDDAGVKAEINRKGEVVVKKRDMNKAITALMKSFKREKDMPNLVSERSAYDVVSKARSNLREAYDAHAATELKLYIDNDRGARQQTTSIIKNIQRKMKSGKYDHTKAPKLWSYLVDNGVKKYIKEFGGDAKSMFPKDVRQSVAIELANYYKAEIEMQGGDML